LESTIKPTLDALMMKDPVFKVKEKQKISEQDQRMLHQLQQQQQSMAHTGQVKANAALYLTKLAYKYDEYYYTHVFPALERMRRVVDFNHTEKLANDREISYSIIRPEEETEGEEEEETKKKKEETDESIEAIERAKSTILKEKFVLSPNVTIKVKPGGAINFTKKDFPFRNYLDNGIHKDKAICTFYLKRWKVILASEFRTKWFMENNWSEILQTYTILIKIITLTEGGFNSIKYRHIRDLHYTLVFFMSKSWLVEFSSEIMQIEDKKTFWKQFGYQTPKWYKEFKKWETRRRKEEDRISKIVEKKRKERKEKLKKKQKAFRDAQEQNAIERNKAISREKKKIKKEGPTDPYADEKEEKRLIKEQEEEEKKEKEKEEKKKIVLEKARNMLKEFGLENEKFVFEKKEKEQTKDDDVPNFEPIPGSNPRKVSNKSTEERLKDLFEDDNS